MEESIKSCEGILIGGETAMVIGEGTIVIRINQRCGKDEVEEVERNWLKSLGGRSSCLTQGSAKS